METIVKSVNNDLDNVQNVQNVQINEIMEQAGDIIKRGGLVAFPTETVYGLGGDALNKESSKKIYAAKGRPSDNPLIVHISKWDSIYEIADNVTDEVKLLADTFWPGPLTIVLNKKPIVPMETTGGLETVAIRMPNHSAALSFIENAGGFIAAPSANLSGRPSPTIAKHVIDDMTGRIEMIIDGGAVGIGVESTIVDMTGEKPTILRPGFVTEEMIERVLGQVEVDKTILDNNTGERPKAPGMKYRHYAPKGNMYIFENNVEDSLLIEKINEFSKSEKAKGEKVGVLCCDEIFENVNADIKYSVGSRKETDEIARRLYKILRDFDDDGVTVIFSESFSPEGFGQAVMNRLLKAAGFNILKI